MNLLNYLYPIKLRDTSIFKSKLTRTITQTFTNFFNTLIVKVIS